MKKIIITNIGDEGQKMEISCCEEARCSDGYHTFDELYEHRIVLFIALCNALGQGKNSNDKKVWKSKLHSDGTSFDGWFILGMNKEKGEQITYHIPIKYWDECFFEELEKAPEWDGHTANDVLERLKKL